MLANINRLQTDMFLTNGSLNHVLWNWQSGSKHHWCILTRVACTSLMLAYDWPEYTGQTLNSSIRQLWKTMNFCSFSIVELSSSLEMKGWIYYSILSLKVTHMRFKAKTYFWIVLDLFWFSFKLLSLCTCKLTCVSFEFTMIPYWARNS